MTEIPNDSGWYPMLMTRAWPLRELTPEFDTYQADRHLPQLMAAPGAFMVQYCANVEGRLPQALRGSGNRLANYVCRSVEELFTWLCSDQFADAVRDGGEKWFGRMNELDGDLYTGNVYEVKDVVPADGSGASESRSVFVERFEVAPAHIEEFDQWMRETHVPALARVDGVSRVRSCDAIREGIPLPYYMSAGNRMVMVDLPGGEALYSTVLSEAMERVVSDSLRWDVKLSYVRRDVYQFLLSAHA
jgi:hypothetical protein